MQRSTTVEGIAYAVHTEPCTYLLDEEGICRGILSPNGGNPTATSDCVGGQFVACLDPRAPGCLVAELRVGGMALFVRADDAGRYVLLRTRAITLVESRAPIAEPPTVRIRPRPPRHTRMSADETITLAKPLFRIVMPDNSPPPPSSKPKKPPVPPPRRRS